MNVMSPPSALSVVATNTGYQSGFGNGFETEALPGALPIGRNLRLCCTSQQAVGARQSRLMVTGGGRTLDVPIRVSGSVR
jgi:hypothetical protein